MYATLKRCLDLSLGLVLFFGLSPLMAATAVLIRLALGPPVLFKQRRPGRYGVPFTLYKFRTMLPVAEAKSGPRSDAQRMTRLGALLRSLSIDELPELYNVIRGHMSLVGPRPLLMVYLKRYTPEQNRRHTVKPGITGWTQVNGRNALSWDEKFALDIWYVDHRSLALDVKILALTIRQVLSRQGVAQAGHVTCDEFRGRGG
jgi:lipopolysaccharide/colanic/teichoic acid biosynthesis glycosyltransferase